MHIVDNSLAEDKKEKTFINPLMPVLSLTGCDECYSTSDIISFDQTRHHLYSSFATGKDIFNDTQMRATGSNVHGICTKMLNFPSTTTGYIMVRIFYLDDAFSGILELEASRVEGQQLQQKDKRRRKSKVKQN